MTERPDSGKQYDDEGKIMMESMMMEKQFGKMDRGRISTKQANQTVLNISPISMITHSTQNSFYCPLASKLNKKDTQKPLH